MSAEIIANELGLDLYKINLSAVVSKYIGETEKNLERIFSEAQYTDAILFFDEADALFGKRSEVKDAHDRYANIETAYLLQRTEEYNGLVILASNIKKNMDEALCGASISWWISPSRRSRNVWKSGGVLSPSRRPGQKTSTWLSWPEN